jgi:hypothetical protein
MRKLIWLPFVVACGSDPGTPGIDAAPNIDASTGREVIGTIHLYEERMVYDDAGTPRENRWVQGWAYYYVGRPPRWHEEVARAGECVLLRYTPSLCTPECTTGLCVETDVCEPFPTYQSAGALTLTGLAVPVTLEGADGYYYNQQVLPEDVFADDAVVTAHLSGAAYPAHAITAGGVPEIVPAITLGKIRLVAGQDHTLRWTPAAGDARVHVTINANNRGHGAPYLGIIECDSADSAGQVTIAAALVDGFPETQAWEACAGSDCPPSTIRRYRRGVTAIGDADAELIVASQFSFGVDHTP